MMTPADPTIDPKGALRREALARRQAEFKVRGEEAAQEMTGRLRELGFDRGKTIAGYWPLGDEIDCRPALSGLAEMGHQIVLPVVAGQGQVLIFRSWAHGDELEGGPFGTSHPGAKAPVKTPHVILLPLIAFDKTGHRLGYGAGFYDRTLAALRTQGEVLAVGVAYDAQEIERVPAGPHDQPMDAVVTDKRTLWFKEPASA